MQYQLSIHTQAADADVLEERDDGGVRDGSVRFAENSA